MTEIQEAAEPQRQYGGFWARVLAFLIDGWILQLITLPVLGFIYLLFIVPGAILLAALTGTQGGHGGAKSLLAVLLFILAIALLVILMLLVMTAINGLYSGFLLSRYGSTPGKMILNLKVVDAKTGGNPDFWKAFWREFAKMLGVLPLYAGCVIVAFDAEKRALQDRLCGTRVVKAPPKRKAAASPR